MSIPRHRLEPTQTASDLASYPPPVEVRSIDFHAVAPMRMPQQYAPAASDRSPSGDGPDQWAENSTPESDVLAVAEERAADRGAEGTADTVHAEPDELEFAHS